MTIKIEKPILITGVSISFLLWFLQIIQSSFTQFENFSLFGLIALGGLFWWYKPKSKSTNIDPKSYTSITQIDLDKSFQKCENLLNLLTEEKVITADFWQELNNLKTCTNRQDLRIGIIGRKRSGKSTLHNILTNKYQTKNVTFIDSNNLIDNYTNDVLSIKIDSDFVIKFDLLLFLINGDLTDSELQIIKQITAYNQRLLLIINQQDIYTEDEQIILLKQLQTSLKGIINIEDIINCASSPQTIKVKIHQGEGIFNEKMEKPQPELNLLLNKLENIINNQRLSLILSHTYRLNNCLIVNIKERLNQVRKEKSLPIIEQYQLIAAATAFANPVASLDLLATMAINTQMLMDLSSIYRQKLSLEKAKNASLTIGELMVKLGIVEFSTQTIGSILKSNFVTYLAGGFIQGISAAYLTRIAGLSLIEYLELENNENNDSFKIEQLKQKIQLIFNNNQRKDFLQNFVKNTINQLSLNQN